MPRPAYIICSQGGATDADTGLISAFNVLEVLVIPKEEAARGVGNPFRCIAAWLKLPSDNPEMVYEHQMVMWSPDGTSKVLVDDYEIVFDSDQDPFLLFVMYLREAVFITQGIFRVESRLRMLNGEDWMTQDFPLVVQLSDTADGSDQS